MSINTLTQGPVLHVDGGRELGADLARSLSDLCDEVEAAGAGCVTVRVSGAPSEKAVANVADVAAVSKWEQAVRRFERLRLPTIVAASGECGGAAFDLLLAADVRIAATDLRLFPAVYGEGVWPGMGLFRLVQQLGLAGARRSVLFGMPFSAVEALERGLVDRVSTDPARTVKAATRLLRRYSGPELAIRRQLAFDAQWMSFEDALGQHLAACDRSLRRGRELEI
ncbi:enoyl-CoA hydratase/isomerase family protein [Actinospica sp. MGRD01-02]|uniref:Enoyl-CoA hydratase/isomerase family protein n=1 Tax=Actinospica acidithermotolerans TaxID=2828514 RepID=A0A941IGQ0_9ACTN|nr:enoyl-CoA-hydratase DpgB [Actinospica acidithermotolerans]MBR7826379.1 enoyl-CoA hydratase/isomerase family protein [Actinospica acidithermotolerans]